MGEQTVKIPTMWNIKQAAEKTGLSQFTINQLVKTQQIQVYSCWCRKARENPHQRCQSLRIHEGR